MDALASISALISSWLSVSHQPATASISSSLVGSRLRLVLHTFLLVFATVTWIWTAVREHAGDGYESDYQAQYLLGLMSLYGIGLVVLCRVADLIVPPRFNILRLRFEFIIAGTLAYAFLSFTMAITYYTLDLWPETLTSNPNNWSPPPLNRSFVELTLLASTILQTAYFLLACNLLSVALVSLKSATALETGAEARVMFDLATSDEEEAVGSRATLASGGSRGYGTLEIGEEEGLFIAGAPAFEVVAKDGVEGDLEDGRRSYCIGLGLLSSGVVCGSVIWILFGGEADVADISLLIISSLTTWISASYLFLPHHLKPSNLPLPGQLKRLPSHLLPALLPLILYPIPTILFTLPPIPSLPPTSESNPPPPRDSAPFDYFISHSATLAITCAWIIQLWALLALVRELVPLPYAGWEQEENATNPRADLFFPPPERSEEQEGLLSGRRTPLSPISHKTARSGGSWRAREDERRRQEELEFELEDEEMLDGEQAEVVRLMSAPSSASTV